MAVALPPATAASGEPGYAAALVSWYRLTESPATAAFFTVMLTLFFGATSVPFTWNVTLTAAIPERSLPAPLARSVKALVSASESAVLTTSVAPLGSAPSGADTCTEVPLVAVPSSSTAGYACSCVAAAEDDAELLLCDEVVDLLVEVVAAEPSLGVGAACWLFFSCALGSLELAASVAALAAALELDSVSAELSTLADD